MRLPFIISILITMNCNSDCELYMTCPNKRCCCKHVIKFCKKDILCIDVNCKKRHTVFRFVKNINKENNRIC